MIFQRALDFPVGQSQPEILQMEVELMRLRHAEKGAIRLEGENSCQEFIVLNEWMNASMQKETPDQLPESVHHSH